MGKAGELFWGRTLLPANKALEMFGANLGEIFGNFVSNFASLFLGNYLQQKCDVKRSCGFLLVVRVEARQRSL